MRILFVAAAVALSVSAVQAQEMLPAKSPEASETGDRAMPVQTPPSARLIEQLKAAGELKEPKVLEAPAPRLDPVDSTTNARPAESQPPVVRPAAAPAAAPAPAPVAAVPAAAPAPAPVAAAPAAAPAPAAATETAAAKPAEVTPAETKPARAAKVAKPVKKRVVRSRETDEQKARRIAAKYGIHW